MQKTKENNNNDTESQLPIKCDYFNILIDLAIIFSMKGFLNLFGSIYLNLIEELAEIMGYEFKILLH